MGSSPKVTREKHKVLAGGASSCRLSLMRWCCRPRRLPARWRCRRRWLPGRPQSPAPCRRCWRSPQPWSWWPRRRCWRWPVGCGGVEEGNGGGGDGECKACASLTTRPPLQGGNPLSCPTQPIPHLALCAHGGGGGRSGRGRRRGGRRGGGGGGRRGGGRGDALNVASRRGGGRRSGGLGAGLRRGGGGALAGGRGAGLQVWRGRRWWVGGGCVRGPRSVQQISHTPPSPPSHPPAPGQRRWQWRGRGSPPARRRARERGWGAAPRG